MKRLQRFENADRIVCTEMMVNSVMGGGTQLKEKNKEKRKKNKE